MGGLESDTIGGYNSFLAKQKNEPGRAFVTTVLFDDRYETIHDRADIASVAPLTTKEYYARGCTALLDAVGRTVTHIASLHKALGRHAPEKTLFVITTDGLENASREYTAEKVKKLIEKQKKAGWEFLFLGANIDAVATAKQYGIDEDRAVTYQADSRGTELNFEAVDNAVRCFRSTAAMPKAWKKDIETYRHSH